MSSSSFSNSPLDRLWKEYSAVFQDLDDLTLARWMAQTLGQIEGRSWRLSHPLLGAYRLAAQLAHDRQIWFKRLVAIPPSYVEAPCCRAPLLPLITRDVADAGLACQHCGESCAPLEDLAENLQTELRDWAELYRPVHGVAHWEDDRRKRSRNYDGELDKAAEEAERLLARVGREIAPRLLEFYPAVVWEDQDECLEVRPEDIEL